MANRFNYRCPKCGSQDHIEITSFVSLRLTSDGAEITEDVAHIDADWWSSENSARCDACSFNGTASDFEPTGGAVIELFPPQASRR
jgi:hypothetical protein